MSAIDPALERVGLLDRGDDRFRTYSLGMKQRLGLASVLMKDPELLVLDEPANGLDPAGLKEVRDLLRSLADEGRTVFLSSHLLGEVQAICDSVAILARGRCIAQGPVDEVLAVRGGSAFVVRAPKIRKAKTALQRWRLPGDVPRRQEHPCRRAGRVRREDHPRARRRRDLPDRAASGGDQPRGRLPRADRRMRRDRASSAPRSCGSCRGGCSACLVSSSSRVSRRGGDRVPAVVQGSRRRPRRGAADRRAVRARHRRYPAAGSVGEGFELPDAWRTSPPTYDKRFVYARTMPDATRGVAVALFVLAFIVAASFVGAELGERFDDDAAHVGAAPRTCPRREGRRGVGARSRRRRCLTLAFLDLVFLPVAALRGTTEGLDGSVWWTLARIWARGPGTRRVRRACVGAAIATITRNTAGAVGVAFGYGVIVENLLSVIAGRTAPAVAAPAASSPRRARGSTSREARSGARCDANLASDGPACFHDLRARGAGGRATRRSARATSPRRSRALISFDRVPSRRRTGATTPHRRSPSPVPASSRRRSPMRSPASTRATTSRARAACARAPRRTRGACR